MLKLICGMLLLITSLRAFACCEDMVQKLVDDGNYSKAYLEFLDCYDKGNHEQVFALAVLYMNSSEDKSELDEKTNIEIVELLKKSLQEGHLKSRLLLAELYYSDKFKGITQNKKLSKCLRDDTNADSFYENCFEVK